MADARRSSGRREVVALAATEAAVGIRSEPRPRMVVGDEDRVIAGILGRLDLLEKKHWPRCRTTTFSSRVGREARRGRDRVERCRVVGTVG